MEKIPTPHYDRSLQVLHRRRDFHSDGAGFSTTIARFSLEAHGSNDIRSAREVAPGVIIQYRENGELLAITIRQINHAQIYDATSPIYLEGT